MTLLVLFALLAGAGTAFGQDVRDAKAVVSAQRLYRLVDLPRAERHVLSLRFAPRVAGYAFTFG